MGSLSWEEEAEGGPTGGEYGRGGMGVAISGGEDRVVGDAIGPFPT